MGLLRQEIIYETKYYKPKNKNMKLSQSASNILRTFAFFVVIPLLTYLQEQIPGFDIPIYYKIAIAGAITFVLKLIIPPVSEPPTTTGGPKPKIY